jgi:uncharacterized iron-regulated protein
MPVRALIAVAFLFLAGVPGAEACKYRQGPFLQELAAQSKTCTHVLCGRIFATAAPDVNAPKSSCSDDPWIAFKTAVSAALSSHGILILGEQHDAAAHHKLQAAAVREFAKTGRDGTAVVFEQIRDDQQAGLDRFKAEGSKSVGDLKRFIAWDKSGWPKDIYDPLFKAVVDARLPIYPGDVPRASIMKAAKEGEGALSASEKKRLGLDVPLGAKFDAASIKEIEEAHCGALPKAAFPGMAYAQRYRDAHLADAALRASQRTGGAILIAGTGHARSDRGVPWYVRRRAPEKKIVSVMFVEVEDGTTDPEAYVPRDPDGKPAADFLVFTPRTERGDPCEKMRAK